MKDKTFKRLLSIYGVIRNIINPPIYPKDESRYLVDLDTFVDKVNSMPYINDRVNGLIDWCDSADAFWNESKNDTRDCDDFSFQFMMWGYYNGYFAHEYIVINNKEQNFIKGLETSHYVCVLEKEGVFYLMNYNKYGPFNSENDAIEFMKNFTKYSDGLIYCNVRNLDPKA